MYEFEQEQEATRARLAVDQQELLMCYAVFETDSRARRLLEQWKRQTRKPLPIDSPVQAYAAKEVMRNFIDIIEDNMVRARESVGVPNAKPANAAPEKPDSFLD